MRDRWTELCEQAITELDHTKFRAILRELNQLLDQSGCFPGSRSANLASRSARNSGTKSESLGESRHGRTS